ncbi:hypothetical protein QE450_002126 [Paenibacillus sp. SORGH_AS306]|uniref:hypothetical protein n=1 Tax=unclassified Paenibacillus TaxID=185978 RepID=UPI00277E97C0|nr:MULTISPECIES: hypothetical protein [unclassified Paenibacillus]MDQ1234628.1 hypothetical protein [Paenibacillus sp. SORGH_AS_0306]MDR6111673.1 hypothetical protein [Paenibacillus sp. SORGH_AS_0338]
MTFFDHKKVWFVTIIVMLLFMIMPSRVNIVWNFPPEIVKQYHFGQFSSFLTLQTSDDLTGYENLLYIIMHTEKVYFRADSFFVSLMGCYITAYLLVKVWRALRKRLSYQ